MAIVLSGAERNRRVPSSMSEATGSPALSVAEGWVARFGRIREPGHIIKQAQT